MKTKFLLLLFCAVAQVSFRQTANRASSVFPLCDFSMPDAFTPNNDGTNDFFCLQGWEICVKKFSIKIFDRWGEEVFSSDNPSFCWDGKYNNRMLEPGMYLYVISAKANDDANINKKGSISLIR